MVTFENHVGRLVEIRTFPPFGRDESEGNDRMAAILRSHAEPVVLCVDLRQAMVLPPERAAQVGAMMRFPSHAIVRQAIVVSPDATILKMQFERLAREASNVEIRVFDSPFETLAWLGGVLSGGERARLSSFLAGSRRKSA